MSALLLLNSIICGCGIYSVNILLLNLLCALPLLLLKSISAVRPAQLQSSHIYQKGICLAHFFVPAVSLRHHSLNGVIKLYFSIYCKSFINCNVGGIRFYWAYTYIYIITIRKPIDPAT